MQTKHGEEIEDAGLLAHASPEAAPALRADVGAAAGPRIGWARAAALARAVSNATALGNRAVSRMLSRSPDGYGYEFADDPLNAGGFGPNDATIRVRPGPVRATLIRPRTETAAVKAEAVAEQTPTPEPEAPATPATAFREEIVKIANLLDAAGVVEKAATIDKDTGKEKPGTGGIWKRYDKRIITWAGYDQLKANRKLMGEGYTSCGTVLSNIWNMAADEAKKKGEKIDLTAREFDMHKHPTSWVEASENMPESKRPKPGDAYYLQFLDTRSQSHVCTVKSITKAGPDKEIWVSADGGQRSGAGTPDAAKECTRIYVPSKNQILGNIASQASDGRWLFGWTDVDKRVS